MLRQATSKKNLLIYSLIILLCALFLPSSAMAHKPIFVERSIAGYEQALQIPDAVTSYALVGELKQPRQVDVFTFTIDRETPFYARMSVPKQPEYETFAPAFLLIGPGLPTTNEPPNYPLDLPSDMGRAILLPHGEADEFFEPFTQTTYLQRQFVSRTLQPGTYYLAVYDPAGSIGKYMLATGTRDEFGLKDWLMFPLTWLKLRLWYNPLQTVLMILGLIAGVGTLLYYVKNRKQEQDQ